MENVMYKILDTQPRRKKEYSVMLGDLGSMVPDDGGRMASTYPPPEHRDGMIVRTWLESGDKMRELLSWHIGIFFAQVANIYRNSHHELLDYTVNNPVHFEQNRAQIQQRVRQLFGNKAAQYLARDPTDRPSISDTIEVLYV
jgi:hypothetical protein